MKILNAKMLVPVVIEAEYSSMPKRSKGKPTKMSMTENKIEND